MIDYHAIQDYCTEHSSPQKSLLAALQRETYLKTVYPQMLSGHLQGQLLQWICAWIRPKRALEIGTFTGYSAICIGMQLPEGGCLDTLEANPEYRHISDKYIQRAGLESKINCHHGDALELLNELTGPYDLAFLDANKREYAAYYEAVLPKMAPGGVILADNLLWSGKVIEETDDPDALALRAFAENLKKDERVDTLLLPVRDGLLLIRVLEVKG